MSSYDLCYWALPKTISAVCSVVCRDLAHLQCQIPHLFHDLFFFPFLSVAAPRFYRTTSIVSVHETSSVCLKVVLSIVFYQVQQPAARLKSQVYSSLAHVSSIFKWRSGWNGPSICPQDQIRIICLLPFPSFVVDLNANLQPKMQDRTIWLLLSPSYSLLHLQLISLGCR